MSNCVADILSIIKEKNVKMVDFKMVDINGQYRHVTIPAENFSEDTMKSGIGFDASNYGYAVVEKSDMVFIPDPDTAVIDPFCSIPTLSMTGNAMIIDTPENRPLAQYPRNIVRAAVEKMKKDGVADTMMILPEFEFYLFDQAGWQVSGRELSATVDASQSYWNSATEGQGVIVPKQKNYHIAKPFDTSFECRSEMCMLMKEAGIEINSVRNRASVGRGGAYGRRHHDDQIYHSQHRVKVWKNRHLYAQAHLRRGRKWYARAYAALKGRSARLLRR